MRSLRRTGAPHLVRLALAALLGLVGCGSSSALEAARAGDRAALARAIREDLANGELDADDARDIALAVATRDVGEAKGAPGLVVVQSMAACAKPLQDPLEERAEKDDPVGASTTLMLLDSDLADESDYVHWASDPRPEWRAVGARSLLDPEDRARRRELMLDPDQRVRLGAMRAATEAIDRADVPALLEALRLDPYPMTRTVAARALGELGGEDVVLALRDVWARAGSAEREAIAGAWASRANIDVGGRRELLWAVDHHADSAGIAAAVELARAGGDGSRDAIALLARSIGEGSLHDRVFAVSAAPNDALVTEALLRAKGDDDPMVRVAVLTRIATTMPPKHSRPAIAALTQIAKGNHASAKQAAKSGLATARAKAVLPMYLKDVGDKSDDVRRAAGRGLVRIERPEQAVILTADADASVRVAVSCSILAAR